METIGGHFSAFLNARSNYISANFYYESARSALYSIIIKCRPKHVYIPNYICEAVPDVIERAGSIPIRYSIDNSFKAEMNYDLKSDDLVLLVNYFGLCGDKITEQLKTMPKSQVLVDCSQGMFQEKFDCLATFYSVRKFVPTPDGGFVATSLDLEVESSNETKSIDRYGYLLKRVSFEPEISREDYLVAENSIRDASLREMSVFSKSILRVVDLSHIKDMRRKNFMTLLRGLSSTFDLDLGDQVPLCFPYAHQNVKILRQYLIDNRVLTPKYWPGIIPLNNFETFLLENVVYLPIDHRYTEEHMSHIINLITNFKG